MDAIRADDIKRARRLSAAERLKLALEAMDQGIALKRAELARANPDASSDELDTLLRNWLRS